jgi:hypothetical protein
MPSPSPPNSRELVVARYLWVYLNDGRPGATAPVSVPPLLTCPASHALGNAWPLKLNTAGGPNTDLAVS